MIKAAFVIIMYTDNGVMVFSSLLLYLLLLLLRTRAIEMKEGFGKKPKENGKRQGDKRELRDVQG